MRELSLIVFEENGRAAALYERFGFRAVTRHPTVKHEPMRYGGNLVLMTCELSA